MRAFFKVMSFFLAVMLAMPAQAQEEYPEFDATYDGKVKVFGGEVRLAVRQAAPGHFVFEYSVKPGKFIRLFTKGTMKETTDFSLVDGRPRTDHYVLINTVGSKPRNGEVNFNWEENTVTGNYKDKQIDIPIPENAVDRAMLQILLMSDLKQGTLRDEYSVYDKDEFMQVRIERLGEETVKVPIGTYSTVILRNTSADGSTETTLWCAPELNYLPVLIETRDDGSKVLTAKLAALTGLPADSQ